MQKLEMLIKTVDAHYDSKHQIQCFYLSCSLVNIARGTCNLIIANEKSNFQIKITIKYERAEMSGSIRVKDNYFDINMKLVVEAFQRRFLAEKINGIIDGKVYSRILDVSKNTWQIYVKLNAI